MMRTIILNGTEFPAFEWTEAAPVLGTTDDPVEKHTRGEKLISDGLSEIAPGEVFFRCDLTFAFDTTFTMKGDGRKFVIIASENGQHVAKPY